MQLLWRYPLVAVALVAGSLLVVACGGEEGEEEATPATATQAPIFVEDRVFEKSGSQ